MIDTAVREAARFHVAILAKSVVPLFGVDDEKRVVLVASATLVQIGDGSTFLFTAGHAADVFQRFAPMLAWPTPGRAPVKIVGDGFTSGPKEFNRARDVLDLTFFELPRETGRELRAAGALVLDGSALSYDAPAEGLYAAIGYPLAASTRSLERNEYGEKVCILEAPPKVLFATLAPSVEYCTDRPRSGSKYSAAERIHFDNYWG